MKRARTLFLACILSPALLASVPGCAAIMSALPTVIAAVTDATQILDAIEKFVHDYFVANPDKDKELKVSKALAKARGALNVALRTANGAEKLDQQKADEAFKDFKVAYQELMVLVGPLGVKTAGNLSAAPGQLTVPEPVALTLKVK